MVIAGDFNIAPADVDVYDPAGVRRRDRTRALPSATPSGRLMARGFVDVFRARFPDAKAVYSWWDYRRGDFHQGRGLRIDLVLAAPSVTDRVEWVVIDRNARKGQSAQRPRTRRRRPARLNRPRRGGRVAASRAARIDPKCRAALIGPKPVMADSSSGDDGVHRGDGRQLVVRADLVGQDRELARAAASRHAVSDGHAVAFATVLAATWWSAGGAATAGVARSCRASASGRPATNGLAWRA